jgi:hypothetical protein
MKSKLFKEVEDALKHHGVKGMRWGVRRKRTPSADASTIAVLKKKKVFELSDAELKKINNRLNLEKQYRQLNPTAKDKVRKSVKSVGTILNNKKVKEVLSTAAFAYAKKVYEEKRAAYVGN